MDVRSRSFEFADETISLPRLRSEMIAVGSLGVAHNVHEPGWVWSVDVRPSAGTPWCETRHVGYCLGGRLHVDLEDGSSFVISAGEVFDIPPGHDGRVVGEEPFETVEWLGVRGWLADHATLQERIVATIVFTDIVASTATARRLGERPWSDLLATYEGTMRDVVATHSGRVVKFTGDGVLAVFDGVSRALRCAVAMRYGATDLGLGTRTAVHTGEITVAEADVHGLAVHETSRMLAGARDGEILVSATSRTLADDVGFAFEDRGEHELRDIVGLRRLYAIASV